MWLSVFLLFALIGMARAGYTKQEWEARDRLCGELAGTYVELTGHVGAVEEAEGTVQLTLEGNDVRPAAGERKEAALAGGDRSVSGGRQIPRVLVLWKTDGDGEMPEAREFKAGSKVTVRGQLALFARARNPGEFDSRNYYRGQGVDCRLYGEEVERSGGDVSPIPECLRRIREKAKQNIK